MTTTMTLSSFRSMMLTFLLISLLSTQPTAIHAQPNLDIFFPPVNATFDGIFGQTEAPVAPTPAPVAPTPAPVVPTPAPTSPLPSSSPTEAAPSVSPSLSMSPTTSAKPSLTPSVSLQPSGAPTTSPPTTAPTESPAPSPSPSEPPTERPTGTDTPSSTPSEPPTESPAPSPSPSEGPTDRPSEHPSEEPSPQPTVSLMPSSVPSEPPSGFPSEPPTPYPTMAPTVSAAPSMEPSSFPTPFPTPAPSSPPTPAPTTSANPTPSPTSAPSKGPTPQPSAPPTGEPSGAPSQAPTGAPTKRPTQSPTTLEPTKQPTPAPSSPPTPEPSADPTAAPSEVSFKTKTGQTDVFLLHVDREMPDEALGKFEIATLQFIKDTQPPTAGFEIEVFSVTVLSQDIRYPDAATEDSSNQNGTRSLAITDIGLQVEFRTVGVVTSGRAPDDFDFTDITDEGFKHYYKEYQWRLKQEHEFFEPLLQDEAFSTVISHGGTGPGQTPEESSSKTQFVVAILFSAVAFSIALVASYYAIKKHMGERQRMNDKSRMLEYPGYATNNRTYSDNDGASSYNSNSNQGYSNDEAEEEDEESQPRQTSRAFPSRHFGGGLMNPLQLDILDERDELEEIGLSPANASLMFNNIEEPEDEKTPLSPAHGRKSPDKPPPKSIGFNSFGISGISDISPAIKKWLTPRKSLSESTVPNRSDPPDSDTTKVMSNSNHTPPKSNTNNNNTDKNNNKYGRAASPDPAAAKASTINRNDTVPNEKETIGGVLTTKPKSNDKFTSQSPLTIPMSFFSKTNDGFSEASATPLSSLADSTASSFFMKVGKSVFTGRKSMQSEGGASEVSRGLGMLHPEDDDYAAPNMIESYKFGTTSGKSNAYEPVENKSYPNDIVKNAPAQTSRKDNEKEDPKPKPLLASTEEPTKQRSPVKQQPPAKQRSPVKQQPPAKQRSPMKQQPPAKQEPPAKHQQPVYKQQQVAQEPATWQKPSVTKQPTPTAKLNAANLARLQAMPKAKAHPLVPAPSSSTSVLDRISQFERRSSSGDSVSSAGSKKTMEVKRVYVNNKKTRPSQEQPWNNKRTKREDSYGSNGSAPPPFGNVPKRVATFDDEDSLFDEEMALELDEIGRQTTLGAQPFPSASRQIQEQPSFISSNFDNASSAIRHPSSVVGPRSKATAYNNPVSHFKTDRDAAASYTLGARPMGNEGNQSGDNDKSSVGGMSEQAGSYDVFAPSGPIGIVVDTSKKGPAVHSLKSTSPMLGLINPGDLIIALDDEDTRKMTAASLTRLMAKKSRQRERKITLVSLDGF